MDGIWKTNANLQSGFSGNEYRFSSTKSACENLALAWAAWQRPPRSVNDRFDLYDHGLKLG
jgi:hypothetical protein